MKIYRKWRQLFALNILFPCELCQNTKYRNGGRLFSVCLVLPELLFRHVISLCLFSEFLMAFI